MTSSHTTTSPGSQGLRLRQWMTLVSLLVVAAWCSQRPSGDGAGGDTTLLPPERQPTATPPPSPAPPATDRPERLHIWLRSLRNARYTMNVPPVPFEALWPTPDDPRWNGARFRGLATADALLELSAHHLQLRQAEHVLPIADAEGLLGPVEPETPEAALLSLYATWIQMEVDRRRAWDAFVGPHLAEGEQWSDLDAATRATVLAAGGTPDYDPRPVREVADQILARWPDHPVADHALLALVRAESARLDEAAPGETVAELLGAIRSPDVKVQAGQLLTTVGAERVSPSLLDAAGSVPPGSPQADLRLATWAMNRAVYREDWSRARHWADRVRSTLAEACAAPDPDFTLHCESRDYELRDVSARLVALGLDTPRTWQEALTAAAWRCHLAGPGHQGLSRAEGTWDGSRWTFGAWDHPTPVTGCLSAVHRLEPSPAAPVRVALTLEGGESVP